MRGLLPCTRNESESSESQVVYSNTEGRIASLLRHRPRQTMQEGSVCGDVRTSCAESSDRASNENEGKRSFSARDRDTCWICFEGATTSQPLAQPCRCPRKVHRNCMARWQLQQAGKHEEQFCRFCSEPLPDWRPFLTPEFLQQEMEKTQPTMMVTFNKKMCFVPVKSGDQGLKEFTETVRKKFGLDPGASINVTFGCRDPMLGSFIKLEGQGAFNAAVHCAAVSAAARHATGGESNGQNRERSIPNPSQIPPPPPPPPTDQASSFRTQSQQSRQ